jgi:hypothetical protein
MNFKEKAREKVKKRAQRDLATVAFPMESLPDDFHYLLRCALRNNSIAALKVSPDTYKAFISGNRPLFMGEVDIALLVIKSMTPEEMGVKLEDYLEQVVVRIYEMYNIYIAFENKFISKIKSDVKGEFIRSYGLPINVDLYE